MKSGLIKEFLKDFILPPGPILALTLIGLLSLGAVLYYRAVEIQRFLEPALALSQPRNEVAEGFNQLIAQEFGKGPSQGVRFSMGSIFINEPLLFADDRGIRKSAEELIRKLGHVFLSALQEKRTGSYVDLILVCTRYPFSERTELNNVMRVRMQRRSELILEYMYRLEPELEKKYGQYFVSVALPIDRRDERVNHVEFRIIPGEMLHIEVLTRLRKYVK